MLFGARLLGLTPGHAVPLLSGLLLLDLLFSFVSLCLEAALVPDGGDGVLRRFGVKDLGGCDDPSLNFRNLVLDVVPTLGAVSSAVFLRPTDETGVRGGIAGRVLPVFVSMFTNGTAAGAEATTSTANDTARDVDVTR